MAGLWAPHTLRLMVTSCQHLGNRAPHAQALWPRCRSLKGTACQLIGVTVQIFPLPQDCRFLNIYLSSILKIHLYGYLQDHSKSFLFFSSFLLHLNIYNSGNFTELWEVGWIYGILTLPWVCGPQEVTLCCGRGPKWMFWDLGRASPHLETASHLVFLWCAWKRGSSV